MSSLRTLPLVVQVAPGESVDSWLEELARRYHVAPRSMLPLLGIAPVVLTSTLYSRTGPVTWQKAAAAAGVGAADLRAAAGRHLRVFPALPRGGSRYCPRCLAESGGRWQVGWRSRWYTVCLKHRVYLAESCPACRGALRVEITAGRELAPAICARRLTDRRRCAEPLGQGAPPAADRAALETQRWIENLAYTLTRPPALEAQKVLADLPAVFAWAASVSQPGPHPPPPDGATVRTTLADTAPPATARLLAVARVMLTGSEQAAIEAIREITALSPRGFGHPPPGMGPARWRALTPTFPGRYLHAADRHLNVGERLRTKSMTPTPARPTGTPRRRADLLPQLLWPEYAARMLPPRGFHADMFRAAISACVLVPGATERSYAEIAARLNPHLYRATITLVLKSLGEAGASTHLDPILTAIARLADHLDQHGGQVDYRRRREITAELTMTMTYAQWRDMACAAGAHPGDNSPTGKFLSARRHLHQLLTGDDLTDPAHPLALSSAAERTRHLSYTAALTPALRHAFYARATQFLTEHAIDEPVVWHPPTTLLDGLDLPGINLDHVDLESVKRIVIDEKQPLRNAAQMLGIHLEHVRFALERIERPERVYRKGGPTSWQREQELAKILTPEYFEREYDGARRTLREIAQSLGTTRRIVADIAHRHGIDTNQKLRKTTPIDEAWLRERYERDQRSTSQIADELGVTQMIVNRAVARAGIPLRPSGIASHPHKVTTADPRLTPEIRAAVEGVLHGWKRLRRFQIAMALPSLDQATTYLGLPTASLVNQLGRLEADIGTKLFNRSRPRTPHSLTPAGTELLRALRGKLAQQHMADALGSEIEPMPDQAAIDAANTRFLRRSTPSTPTPYNDIPVARIRITAHLLRILKDITTHGEPRFYGQQVLERTGIDAGTLYPALQRLHTAGWMTKTPEDDREWLARATPGRGPGRRRQFYTLTPEGRRAAETEITNRAKHSKKVPET